MIQRLLLLTKTRLQEGVRYSRVLRSVNAILLTIRGLLSLNPAVRLCWLCRAYVVAEHAFLWESIACAVNLTCQTRGERELDWRKTPNAAVYHRWQEIHPSVDRTAMPKAPRPDGEKGVLLSTFEYNWLLMLADPEAFRALCQAYNIVFSTSWSPTDYHVLAQALIIAPGVTFWVQPCNLRERAKIEAFHPRLKVLETMPCDWLNPEFFPQKPFAERDIDLLMVSNWAPFKRHWALFNALRDLPASLRVVCIGQPDTGRTLDDIRRLQRLMGAPQEIEFLERLPIEQVSALQCRAKVGVILSLWEGCCVAAAEALMAGSPLAMCENAHVGPLAYISEDTGVRLSRVPKAAEIARALKEAPQRHPRAFAEGRLSYLVSTASLNEVLRVHELAAGRPWTQDLVPICWRPHPKIASAADNERMASAYAALHHQFPKVFPSDLQEISQR
ncbi:MAG: glycosyltransferase [Verrucomicrobiaceae bacterium]|nr:glycosyltransferase [Verrucomicrobiaceae bacterium]